MAIFGLSKSLAPGIIALSARKLTSLALTSEALKLLLLRKIIGLSTSC